MTYVLIIIGVMHGAVTTINYPMESGTSLKRCEAAGELITADLMRGEYKQVKYHCFLTSTPT